MRLIDADKLKTHYSWWGNKKERWLFDEIVDMQPTVETAAVIHGAWKAKLLEPGVGYMVCSVCRCVEFWETPYCPNCGAKMDGDKLNDHGAAIDNAEYMGSDR